MKDSPVLCKNTTDCKRDIRFLLVTSDGDKPRPMGVCGFSRGSCGWKNDPNNWEYKWASIPGADPAMCLARADLATEKSDAEEWLAFEDEADKRVTTDAKDVQVKLWSPKIPSKAGLRCITIAYYISLGPKDPLVKSENSSLGSLAMLQRQEG